MSKPAIMLIVLTLCTILASPSLALAWPDRQNLVRGSQAFERTGDRILSGRQNLPADFNNSLIDQQLDGLHSQRDLEAGRLVPQEQSKVQASNDGSGYGLVKSLEYAKGSWGLAGPPPVYQTAQVGSSGTGNQLAKLVSEPGEPSYNYHVLKEKDFYYLVNQLNLYVLAVMYEIFIKVTIQIKNI
jgi:hypothetical protein